MPDADKPELGKIAYDAHCAALLRSYPAWDQLTDDEQYAWQVCAKAVITWEGNQ